LVSKGEKYPLSKISSNTEPPEENVKSRANLQFNGSLNYRIRRIARADRSQIANEDANPENKGQEMEWEKSVKRVGELPPGQL